MRQKKTMRDTLTGIDRYVLMEMPIPTIPDPARWQTVMEHLQKADE